MDSYANSKLFEETPDLPVHLLESFESDRKREVNREKGRGFNQTS